jgi:hypothetical protein
MGPYLVGIPLQGSPSALRTPFIVHTSSSFVRHRRSVLCSSSYVLRTLSYVVRTSLYAVCLHLYIVVVRILLSFGPSYVVVCCSLSFVCCRTSFVRRLYIIIHTSFVRRRLYVVVHCPSSFVLRTSSLWQCT